MAPEATLVQPGAGGGGGALGGHRIVQVALGDELFRGQAAGTVGYELMCAVAPRVPVVVD